MRFSEFIRPIVRGRNMIRIAEKKALIVRVREPLLRLQKQATYPHDERKTKKSHRDAGMHQRTAVAILMGLGQFIVWVTTKETPYSSRSFTMHRLTWDLVDRSKRQTKREPCRKKSEKAGQPSSIQNAISDSQYRFVRATLSKSLKTKYDQRRQQVFHTYIANYLR